MHSYCASVFNGTIALHTAKELKDMVSEKGTAIVLLKDLKQTIHLFLNLYITWFWI